MTTPLPQKLKQADIQRFALRASQLQSAAPAISYWCEYWIVNQLLAKGLHSADSECLTYTTALMDKLETTKTQNADNEAIISDVAGQIYVEQFGLDTFERAERAMEGDRVTKQTADTLLAAATFLELINIWATPSADLLAKIKYAKFHAVRILKAYKEGKDPNATNPHPELEGLLDENGEKLIPLDPNDPEVQALGGVQTGPLQPTVEEVEDEQDAIQADAATTSRANVSLHPSQQPSAQHSPGLSPLRQDDMDLSRPVGEDVSPLEESPNSRSGSIGGGYFPDAPSTLPSAPSHAELDAPNSDDDDNAAAGDDDAGDISAPPEFPLIPTSPPQSQPVDPVDFYRDAPLPPTSLPTIDPPHVPIIPVAAPPIVPHMPVSNINAASTASINGGHGSNNDQEEVYTTDDIQLAKAQKHCKWAISALNFDDSKTAVRELREALRTLGARV